MVTNRNIPRHKSFDQERWQSEANYFDDRAVYEVQELRPTDPLTLRRYSPPLRKRFNKEFRFQLMGDLRGKSVLDVGCGDGSNAVILAQLGAFVTGIDVSPGAIDLAWRRAEINGVKGLVRFCCSPIETADIPENSFDIVWGEAILHHLVADLDQILGKLVHCAKPGALFVFAEPINFNNTLRKLRLMLPLRAEGTADERPLEPADIGILASHIAGLHVRPYRLFGRLERFILPSGNYEQAEWPRRGAANAIAALDYLLLSIPGVAQLGGVAVIYGTR